MKRTVAAVILLVSAVWTIGAAAQIRARKKSEPPMRVVYTPTGAAISTMSVEAAAQALKSALIQMHMEHQGEPIVDVEIDDGTLAGVTSRLKSAGSGPDRDRTFGATGPGRDQVKGVLIIRAGRKQRASVVAVRALAPIILIRDDTTIVSGNGPDADRSTAIGYSKDTVDDALLRRAANALLVLRLAGGLQGEAAYQREFDQVVVTYRSAAVKPPVPESARRFQVQASAAVRAKDFQTAIDRYGDGLRAFPAWPDAHFDLALQLATSHAYAEAIVEMNRFLALVPDSPDARRAQDQIYEWEGQTAAVTTIPFMPQRSVR
jgi:hypothetical protein